jgi:hypothetical protein
LTQLIEAWQTQRGKLNIPTRIDHSLDVFQKFGGLILVPLLHRIDADGSSWLGEYCRARKQSGDMVGRHDVLGKLA